MNFILLCGEFAQVTPAGMAPDVWRAELRDIADQLTASCREVDPASTDEAIQLAHESGHRWNTDKHG